MTSSIVTVVVAAVLVFWAVGAHNRLVALRNAIVASFGPLDEQYRLRLALLRQQGETLASALALAPDTQTCQWIDALAAAAAQADAACAHARTHPGATGAIASLRMAEGILAAARARSPAQLPLAEGLAELQTRLAGCDTALEFNRQRFNEAVGSYNAAVRQFPTWLIAALFGFKPAGLL
jgi:LemA protein